MKKRGLSNFWKLVISIIAVQLVGIISSFFTVNSISNWYAFLNKPFFNPPNWLFGPVWTILYLMIGVALFIVWKNENKTKVKIKKKAYWFFGIQLLLNFLWSIVFFGMQQTLLAFIVIILLWIFILMNIIYFYKISKVSGYMLIPYLVWVSFAALLNFSIWWLNR